MLRFHRFCWIIVVISLSFASAGHISVMASVSDLRTVADESQFRKTGRYEEVVQLCSEFEKRYPKEVRCFEFGKTPEGRPMKALAVSRAGALDPKSAHELGKPVLLFQGGIHSGEIDGKDASFWWLREALQSHDPALEKVTVVLVPVFNIDGHERFGAHNRPNQVGPEEMGWRVTGQNLNLNRDYMKAEAPEMQAMLHLLDQWDPILYVDMHVTDGAQFQHTVSLNFRPGHLARDLHPDLNRQGHALESALEKRLTALGDKPLTFYPEFIREDDPSSGFEDSIGQPRFSEEYWALRNRIGMLLETHSWKDYETRVRVTHDTIKTLVDLAAKDGTDWLKAASKADRSAAEDLPGREVVLSYENTKKSHLIDFQGYSYERVPSAISGGTRIIYDPSKKEVWKIPLFDELQAKTKAKLPKAGYVIEAAEAQWMRAKLDLHGIRYQVLEAAYPQLELKAFRSTEPEFAPKSYEGRQTLKVQGEWSKEKRDLGAGAIFVPIGQARALLIANLLEPRAEDSLLAWGFFNAFFERKEYMENYVTEDVAEKMLAADPALKLEFSKKIAAEPDFAKDPEKRLEFFYKRHPSWDERFGLYPVYKLDDVPKGR